MKKTTVDSILLFSGICAIFNSICISNNGFSLLFGIFLMYIALKKSNKHSNLKGGDTNE